MAVIQVPCSSAARGHGVGELGVAAPVVGDPAHAARQLVGGEQPGPDVVGGDDELHRGVPVRVEHHHGVVVERSRTPRARSRSSPGTRLISWPSLRSRRSAQGEHDRRDVSEQARSGNLTHRLRHPSGA